MASASRRPRSSRVALQVCGGDPGRELLVQAASELLRVGDDVHDDLSEERVLVGVVVVHGALREAGQRRDLLHRRARIPLAQEQRPRRLDDGRPRPDDARVIRTRPRKAPSSALCRPSRNCTHE